MQDVENLHDSILKLIYQIVKEDTYPLKYQVHPRELILRSMQDWSAIQNCLSLLETEGAIVTRQLDTFQISITEKGLQWCKSHFQE